MFGILGAVLLLLVLGMCDGMEGKDTEVIIASWLESIKLLVLLQRTLRRLSMQVLGAPSLVTIL